jgi:Uma2 family endonuclease
MAAVTSTASPPPKSGPAWEIAELFPDQGDLSESDYLLLTEHTNRMAEFTDGRIEVLPMPTWDHQEIILYLINFLRAFIQPQKLGLAIMAPYRVKISERRYREPDIVFVLQANASRVTNRLGYGADLVMEVVSEDNPDRDLVVKRQDYAEAGISEYWIVDPRNTSITVLRLENGQYATHCELTAAGHANSALLQGFSVDVAAVFAAGRNG